MHHRMSFFNQFKFGTSLLIGTCQLKRTRSRANNCNLFVCSATSHHYIVRNLNHQQDRTETSSSNNKRARPGDINKVSPNVFLSPLTLSGFLLPFFATRRSEASSSLSSSIQVLLYTSLLFLGQKSVSLSDQNRVF